MPVVSITTRSNLSLPSSRFSLSEPRMRMRSPRTVQQMQPLFISTICSSPVSMISLSTPISPNSFSITAMRWPWSSFRIRLSSVVLPLPRNPVRIVTGTMLLSSMTAPGEGPDYKSTPKATTKPNQGQTTLFLAQQVELPLHYVARRRPSRLTPLHAPTELTRHHLPERGVSQHIPGVRRYANALQLLALNHAKEVAIDRLPALRAYYPSGRTRCAAWYARFASRARTR